MPRVELHQLHSDLKVPVFPHLNRVLISSNYIHCMFQIFQLYYQYNQYFVWENLLEWSVYTLAIVYVADEFDVDLLNT